MKFNKKSMLLVNLIIILIAIISFMILINFYQSSNSYLVSSSEDLKCRAFLASKDKLSLIDFLFSIDNYCKKDTLVIKDTKKEKVFDKMALLAQKCSFRYGSGELDFLHGFDLKGSSWCFTCAKFSFKGGNPTTYYNYNNDFYDYLEKKELKNFGGEKEKYLDKVNLVFYKDLNPTELSFMNSLTGSFYLDDQEKEQFKKNKLQNVLYEYNDKLKEYKYYENKKIDRDKKYYVVYRYLVVDNDELMKDVEKSNLAYNSKYGTSVLLLNSKVRTVVFDTAKKFIKVGSKLISNIPGLKAVTTVLALNAAISNDYIQYVTIMGEDEYYRKCGIEPYVLKKRK